MIFMIALCYFTIEMKKDNEAFAIKNQDSSRVNQQEQAEWKIEKKDPKKIEHVTVHNDNNDKALGEKESNPKQEEISKNTGEEKEGIVQDSEQELETAPSQQIMEEQVEDQANTPQGLRVGKVVYLTFDDGPHPVSEEILRLLKKYNAKATFFMLEPNIKHYPDPVKQMVEDGHSVAAHGVSHEVSKVYRSPASFAGEMEMALQYIEELTNVKSRLIRAPYGSKPYITPAFKAASDAKKYILWDWNIDSTDWKLTNGQYVERVIQATEALEGKQPLVVLLHEKPTTVEYLEKLLIYYHDNGYEMEAITETMEPIQFR